MMTLNELCAQLLPPEEHLTFKTLLLGEQGMTLVATMTSPKAACPDCHQLTSRIHSDYLRTLADLPWATMPIHLRLTVRRFFCTLCTCGRQTFTERLPTVAPLYARTTPRLSQRQASTGLALGGAAGAWQLARQGMPGSRPTVLRCVRGVPLPAYPLPHVVGMMIGPGAKATVTAPSSSIWSAAAPLTCSRIAWPRPWPLGFRPIPR